MSWTKVAAKGDIPTGRHSASATTVGDKVYIIGGTKKNETFPDVYAIDKASWTWTKLTTTGDKPPASWGHSATVVNDTQIWVFGGEAVGGCTSNLYVLDTKTLVWSRPSTEGAAPTPRAYHTASLVGSQLYVLGGSNVNLEQDNLFVLDLDKLIWSRVPSKGELPEPKKRHSAVVHQNKLVAFGGWCNSTSQLVTDMDVLDLKTLTWERVQQKGPVPEKRGGHLSISHGQFVFVWGGIGPGQVTEWNATNYFDFDNVTWMTKKTMSRAAPQLRSDAAYSVLEPGKLFIFGGYVDPKAGDVSNDSFVYDISGVY
jgi:N-acetylneuraminic acid mutarotase